MYLKPKKIKKPSNLKECKDLDENKCRICGTTQNLTSHHIINRGLGGDDDLGNLITVCFRCHRNIHDGKLDLKEFLNNIAEKHPSPVWFRWTKVLEILNQRK